MRLVRFHALLTLPLIAVLLLGARPARSASPDALAANKRLVVAFYDAAINKKDYALAVTFLGPEYKQHNPTAADGAAGLKGFIDFLDIPEKSADSNGMF